MEKKKIEREREIDDKTIICMLKNLPLIYLFFFFFALKISLLGISWQFVSNGWRSDLLEAQAINYKSNPKRKSLFFHQKYRVQKYQNPQVLYHQNWSIFLTSNKCKNI
jgi:hypothetical protein